MLLGIFFLNNVIGLRTRLLGDNTPEACAIENAFWNVIPGLEMLIGFENGGLNGRFPTAFATG